MRSLVRFCDNSRINKLCLLADLEGASGQSYFRDVYSLLGKPLLMIMEIMPLILLARQASCGRSSFFGLSLAPYELNRHLLTSSQAKIKQQSSFFSVTWVKPASTRLATEAKGCLIRHPVLPTDFDSQLFPHP